MPKASFDLSHSINSNAPIRTFPYYALISINTIFNNTPLIPHNIFLQISQTQYQLPQMSFQGIFTNNSSSYSRPEHILLPVTVPIPESKESVVRIVCLIDYKCLVVYPSRCFVIDLTRSHEKKKEVNEIMAKDQKRMMDFGDRNIVFYPYEMEGFGIFQRWKLMVWCDKQWGKEIQAPKVIGTPTCEIFIMSEERQTIQNIKRNLARLKINKGAKLTADGHHLLNNCPDQRDHYNLTAFSVHQNETVRTPKKYKLYTSIHDEKVGVVKLSEDNFIIVAEYQKTGFKFLKVNVKKQEEIELFKLPNAQIYSFLSMNTESNLISMVIKSTESRVQLFLYIIYDYQLDRIVFKKEELGGLARLQKYFKISQDLTYMVQLGQDKQNPYLIFRRYVQKKKLYFHLIENSKLKTKFGTGLPMKVLNIL